MSDWTPHRCRKCGGLYVNVRASRSRTPFQMDLEPDPRGNLIVLNEDWQLPQVLGIKPDDYPDVPRFTSHAYSCPIRQAAANHPEPRMAP